MEVNIIMSVVLTAFNVSYMSLLSTKETKLNKWIKFSLVPFIVNISPAKMHSLIIWDESFQLLERLNSPQTSSPAGVQIMGPLIRHRLMNTTWCSPEQASGWTEFISVEHMTSVLHRLLYNKRADTGAGVCFIGIYWYFHAIHFSHDGTWGSKLMSLRGLHLFSLVRFIFPENVITDNISARSL